MEIAFATRPANTVAGDYYDCVSALGVRLRWSKLLRSVFSTEQSYLIAVADVAGKSIPARAVDGDFSGEFENALGYAVVLGETGLVA